VPSDEAQATKDSELKLFAFSTKSTNITAKYTQTDRKKKTRRSERSRTKRKHNKKKTIPTKLDLQRWAVMNAIYSTASYNQKPVIITDSLSTIIAVSDRKRSKNPKTGRSSIHKYHITMGSESRRNTWKRSSRRRSKRSTERKNSPHRNISPTGLDSMDNNFLYIQSETQPHET
jgi:hypothetical protein